VTSVDDFIGGPISEPVPSTTTEVNTNSSLDSFIKPTAPTEFRPVDRPDRNQNREEYQQPQNQGRYQSHGNAGNYGGYRPRYDRGGYRNNNRIQMRRDFAVTETGTQDISVPTETVKGLLTVMPEGHGFLRPKFTPSDRDVYISQSQIRRFLLRNGDMVQGQARSPKENERYWGLLKVEMINDREADGMQERPRFDDLVAIYPNKLLRLETGNLPLSTRIIDLIAPIGFGQRGMIVSPPKAGKTTIMKELAAGITQNFPEVHLMAALIGERPEEVTDISRSVRGEVLASNFDESPQEQTRVAEVALDRAKRLVEMGKDVVILLDSITRLARAYNLVVNPSGRTLSGGFDPAALYPAKKFLGAARCVEAPVGADGQPTGKGGSLTVIGTALVDTGSRMDDMIYEEFKGTGNMELHLSRFLQERRIFPAIDIGKSGTRHDELLLGEDNIQKVTTLRHMLTMLSDEERTQMMIERLKKFDTNQAFLDSLSQGGQ
jgi:transcription termination factor Rho